MPVIKYRLHRKNASGGYDTIHYESSSNIILRPTGETVEETLQCCVLAEDAGDNIPGFVVDADTLGGSTKEEIISTAQAGVDLSNIDAATLGGSTKEQIIAAVPTYTHPTEKVCNYSIDTSSFATKAEIEALEKKIAIGTLGLSTPVLGARIRIGGFDYMIVHFDSSIVYAITEDIVEATQFGSTTVYAGSTIANLCSTWYSTNVPAALKSAGIFVNATTEGVSSPCFIPTYNQCNGGFSYFNSDSRRCAQVASGGGTVENYATDYWWTSTAVSSDRVWSVSSGGGLTTSAEPKYEHGFRPCLAINRSVFS